MEGGSNGKDGSYQTRTWPLTQLSGSEHDRDCLSANLVSGTQNDSYKLSEQKGDRMMWALELDMGEFEFSLHLAMSLGQVSFL